MTSLLKITSAGVVTELETHDVLDAAQYTDLHDEPLAVVPCGWPIRGQFKLVMAVHDFGRNLGMTLNVKGWMLYGRSPIFGPCIVGRDAPPGKLTQRDPLPADFVNMVKQPVYRWAHEHPSFDAPQVLAFMRGIAEREGIDWPEVLP